MVHILHYLRYDGNVLVFSGSAPPITHPAGSGFLGALPFSCSLAIVPVLAAMALDAVPAFIPWAIPWIVLPLLPYQTLLAWAVRGRVPVLDPNTPQTRLYWHRTVLWAWCLSYLALVVLVIWAVGNSQTLTVYERLVVVLMLVQIVFFGINAGHEMTHLRGKWAKRLGEFVYGAMGMSQWYTEHVYIHHRHVATPFDRALPAKGQSFYNYFLKAVPHIYVDVARFHHERMARRGLPFWHRSNPCWRYAATPVVWIGLSLTVGGWPGLAVWVLQSFIGIFTTRMADYIQHYGLQRRRLPNGRYEKVKPHHAWNYSSAADYLMFCVQRHSDHHLRASRPYPLLQDHPEEISPRLPAQYSRMFLLALRPSAWFREMDPLVAAWRRSFYPDIEDWRALSSRAFRERPTSFPLIAEIFSAAPRLADWVEERPVLLDEIESPKFQQLVVPENIGLEPDEMLIAQRGLLRLYYTREFDREEMTDQLALLGVEDREDIIDSARLWSNGHTFQVGVRTMRGNILPVDAGLPLSNIAEAAIAMIVSDVLNEFIERHGPVPGSGLAVAALGRLGDRRMILGSDVELLVLYEDAEPETGRFMPGTHVQSLCSTLNSLFTKLAEGNMLLRSVAVRPPGSQEGSLASGSLKEFADAEAGADTVPFLAEVASARLVHAAGERAATLVRWFDAAKQAIMARHADAAARQFPGLRSPGRSDEPTLTDILNGPGGFADTALAALLLRLRAGEDHPAILKATGVPAVFEAAAREQAIGAQMMEHFAKAARLWLNLDGIRPLLVDGELEESALDESCSATLARACDVDDIGELRTRAKETADRAAGQFDALNSTL